MWRLLLWLSGNQTSKLTYINTLGIFPCFNSANKKYNYKNVLTKCVLQLHIHIVELMGPANMHVLILEMAACQGHCEKTSKSWFPITECSCRIVFLFIASLPPALFPGNSHKTHTSNHTYYNYYCAPDSQPPAACKVTNEYCHSAKHLLALLLQLCSEVLPFFFFFLSRVCEMLKILTLLIRNPNLVQNSHTPNKDDENSRVALS